MNKLLANLAMGASLVSISFTSAFGAVVPSQRTSAPQARDATPATSYQTAPDEAIAIARDDLTGGIRAVRSGDNSRGVMTFEEYLRRFPASGEAGFQAIRKENKETCADTGAIVREALGIAAEAQEIDGELSSLGPILARLGARQNAAAGLQGVAQVVSTGLLCALSAGLYCAAAAAGGVGNIGNTAAYWNTQKVDRKMRYVNIRQSKLQIRATLLTMRANIMWANAMQDYCLKVFPNTTLGEGRTNPLAVYGQAGSDVPPARNNNLLPKNFGN